MLQFGIIVKKGGIFATQPRPIMVFYVTRFYFNDKIHTTYILGSNYGENYFCK